MSAGVETEGGALLEVRGLESGYGRSRVLFGIDLDVPARGGVAVLGRNGAGKSTLVKTLMGELPAEAGRVRFGGADVTALRPEQRVRHGMGVVPQEHAVFARLSVKENLQLGALACGPGTRIDRALDMFPKLAGRLAQSAGSLSGGERKMLAMGRALLANPRLLILDEPTEGVWIGVIDEIADRLVLLAREIAVIVIEQHLEMAWRVCERSVVLDRGRAAFDGSSKALREGDEIRRYLAP
jgi:branched-chain amino acid transport system ATP-binding protein